MRFKATLNFMVLRTCIVKSANESALRRSDLTAFRVDGMGRSHQIEGMTQADIAPIEASAVRLLSREEAEREDRLFWHSKTPVERLAAAEQLRQVAYGYDAATARIQAVFIRTVLKEG